VPYLFLFCVLTLSVWSYTTDELIARSREIKLSETRYWHLLMHFKGKESEIDDPAFFVSGSGKSDLKTELEETIRHFSEDTNRTDESIFCRFPARRAWIEQELNVSFGGGECFEYETLIQKVDPQSATLVFPSAHINSPASMFGHTFIRIDSSMQSKLMSYAINYAAYTEDTNGLVFAYKGLFGGYMGFYSMLPYYEKLKEYRDTEARDVWEYDLNLTPDEVMAMVRHIWELQRMNSWYYFFDENCSYHMLWLSEIARPSVHLREHFWYYVIPPDTIRAFEEEGLVEAKHFRPSKRTRLLAYQKTLSEPAIKIVKLISMEGIGSAKLDDFSEEEQRHILDASAELIEYRFIEREIDKETYAKRYHDVLSLRSTLGKGDNINIKPMPNPDTSHQSARIQIVKGWYENRSPWMIGWRPAYHDLDEDDTGHLSGAQIEFLDISAGIDKDKILLEKATILSLSSIAPISHWFKPFSWRMKSGWDREYGNDKLSFVTRLGAGSSIGGDRWYGYVLSEPEIRLGYNADIGIGLTSGMAFEWSYRMKTHLEGGYRFYLDSDNSPWATMSHLWQMDTSKAIYVQGKWQDETEEIRIGLNLYF